MRSTWHAVTHSITVLRTALFTTALSAALLLPMLYSPGIVHADSVVQYGTAWLGGGGVDIMSGGDGTHNCVTVAGVPGGNGCSSGQVYSGDKWQCVEMVNRLYLTKGWTTTTWWGSGSSIINDVPNHPGLTDELQDHISYVNPGDVVTETHSTDGHAGIINTIDSNGTIHIKSQNADLDSQATLTGSLSAGTAHYTLTGWIGYSVQAIVHHPATSNTPGGFPSSAVMDFNSKENVVARGINNEAYINTWQSGIGWSGFSSVQSGAVFAGNPTAVKFNSDGYIFARGTNNEIYRSISSSGAAWGGFTSLQSGATFASDPVAIQFDSNTLNVFAVGTDQQMYENTELSTGWTGFSLLQAGSYFVGNPTVMRFNSKEYVVGRGINNEIYVNTWTSGVGWSGFTRIAPGYTFASDPVVFTFNNVLNIFARGTDNQLYVNYFDTSWHPFSLIQAGAYFSSNPTVAAFGNNENVMARGTDNQMYVNSWTTGTGWSGFSSLSTSTFTGNPVAIQYGTVLNIFARGTDNQMYVNYYDTSWHPFSLIQSGAVFNGFSWQ